jgi:hypothetical protein
LKYLFSFSLVACVFLLFQEVRSQNIIVNEVYKDKDLPLVHIKFIIRGNGNPKERYEINLYSDLDNYKEPLKIERTKLISRGNNMYGASDNPKYYGPGQHELTWNYSSRINGLNVPVKFEIGITMKFSPFELVLPNLSKAKRKKDIEVRWQGGLEEEIILSLMKGDVIIKTREFINNNYHNFPLEENKGKGYTIQISNKDGSNTTTSENFKIKPSIPFIVKIIPFVAGAALAAYVYITYEPPLDPLPAPPEPN